MATAPANPPRNKRKSDEKDASTQRKHWSEQIAKARKRWDTFWSDGDKVIDRFMLEANRQQKRGTDTYNILYSSTETIKPSLYAQTPKAQAKVRATDQQNLVKVNAALLMEQIGEYSIERVDYDGVMKNVVSDYVLPGLGNAWVRYDPTFSPAYDNDNNPIMKDDGSPQEYLTAEGLGLDYVHFRDQLYGVCRFWKECPWVGRRVFFTKPQATKRFGKEKANALAYNFNVQDKSKSDGSIATDNSEHQAIIYEIWDKVSRKAIWYSDDYADDLLDVKDDPLKLENFFPCPEPIRAVWSTRTFVPAALYSQYKAQAAELDRLTERIRYLTEALKVRGIYDGTQEVLKNLLDGPGNRMIPVENWAAILQNKGLDGSVMWVPIKDVVVCLSELLKQREVVKNEIYEISGFSDIVRGVSKASETLGAQQIKADWATGRLKDMQREVQRFCRDLIRIMVEVACEHFSDATLVLYSGVTPPEVTPEEQQAQAAFIQAQAQWPQQQAQYAQQAAMAQQQGQQPPPQPQPPQQPPPTAQQQFKEMAQKVIALIRRDKLRCANIGIETDSTILPDQQKEREDRMQFLSSVGAFLQQAGPMALQFPDMRGLLGAIMMFTIRTFPSSRALEKEFEEFQKKLQAAPPMPPPGQDKGDKGEAAAQATIQSATIKAQSDQQTATAKAQADNQSATMADQTKRYEIDQRSQHEANRLQLDHEYRMAQLALEERKIRLEAQKLGAGIMKEEDDADHEKALAALERQDTVFKDAAESDRADQQQAHQQEMESRKQDLAEGQFDHDAGIETRQQDLSEQQAETQADQGQQQIDNAAKAAQNKPKPKPK